MIIDVLTDITGWQSGWAAECFELSWACGHTAFIVDADHCLDHPHACPVCHPGQAEPGCDLRYITAPKPRRWWMPGGSR